MPELYIAEAALLVAAQARQRPMSEKDMLASVKIISDGLQRLHEDEDALFLPTVHIQYNPKTAIQEHAIVCCICGAAKQMLNASHLAKHGVTPDEYKVMCGYSLQTPLVSKDESKRRRAMMQQSKPWEKIGKVKASQF